MSRDQGNGGGVSYRVVCHFPFDLETYRDTELCLRGAAGYKQTDGETNGTFSIMGWEWVGMMKETADESLESIFLEMTNDE